MLVFHFLYATRHYARLLVPPDRAPLAYLPATRERLSLDQLERYGVELNPPPGPLGPRPVSLSGALIECWLPEDEWRSWKGAGHVGSGMRLLLERLEKEILAREADPGFANLVRDDQSDLPQPQSSAQP